MNANLTGVNYITKKVAVYKLINLDTSRQQVKISRRLTSLRLFISKVWFNLNVLIHYYCCLFRLSNFDYPTTYQRV